jgi:hypothetical protein
MPGAALFGFFACLVEVVMEPGTPSHDIEIVLGVALFAVGRGAKGVCIDLAAVQFLRRQFMARIGPAVEAPDWRDKWRHEEAYLVAQAEALGRHAARLAKQEGRGFIAGCDVAAAIPKVRGHLPMAGRWCPF